MLQGRRQDLESQIRGLREEVEKGQGRLQATHEELLLLRRERREALPGALATASRLPGRRDQSWVAGSPQACGHQPKAK